MGGFEKNHNINPGIMVVVASNRFPGIPGIIRKQGTTVLTSPLQNSTPQEDLFQGLGKLKVLWLTGNHYQPGEKGYKKMKARLMF